MMWEILTIIFLVVLEGFFSGSEIAFLSAPRSVIKALAGKGNRRARRVLESWQRIEKVISTSIAGTTVCVVVASAIGAHLMRKYIGPGWEFLTGLILSPLIIILGEIIPKDLASRHSVWISLNTVYVIEVLSIFLIPLTLLIRTVERFLVGKTEIEEFLLDRKEIRYAIELAYMEGGITSAEKLMSHAMMALSEKTLREVMIPLIQVKAVQKNDPIEKALKILQRFGHSKIPVYSENVINITGYVKIIDAYRKCNNINEPVEKYVQEATYLPETMPCDTALFTMAQKSEQIAIVVDEFGASTGIVTLTDLVEEFLGTLAETSKSEILKNENVYIMNGLTELDRLKKELGINFPENVESVTVGGFLTELLERIPKAGEEIRWNGYLWRVLESDEKRVKVVEVRPIEGG